MWRWVQPRLLPNGDVFAEGASGNNAIYNTETKKWSAGPGFPDKFLAADAPNAVLPNGDVLAAASAKYTGTPEHFYLYNGTTIKKIADPPGASTTPTYATYMLVLPTGQLLVRIGSNLEVYTGSGSPKSSWQPDITSVPTTLQPGETYTVSGKQLNGLTQGANYGDDFQDATNYPLVQITNTATGDVFYAQTADMTSMSVARNNASSANFTLPADIEPGPSTLQVVANGIRSAPVAVNVNPLSTIQSVQLDGGYVSASVAMRNLGYGTIDLTGIPAGSTIDDAYLMWDVLDLSQSAADGEGDFDGNPITGTLMGVGGDPCWGSNGNYGYVADVTSLVSGNGDYDLTDFSSGATNGEDPWNVGSPFPELEGASLIVIYENSSSPLTSVQLLGGVTETDGALLTQTLSGFQVSSSPTASTTYIVADGQGAGSEGTFDGTTLVSNFLGSAPQAVPNYSEGNLWDNLTFNVSSMVNPGDTSETAQVEGDGDCIVWVGQVFSTTS